MQGTDVSMIKDYAYEKETGGMEGMGLPEQLQGEAGGVSPRDAAGEHGHGRAGGGGGAAGRDVQRGDGARHRVAAGADGRGAARGGLLGNGAAGDAHAGGDGDVEPGPDVALGAGAEPGGGALRDGRRAEGGVRRPAVPRGGAGGGGPRHR